MSISLLMVSTLKLSAQEKFDLPNQDNSLVLPQFKGGQLALFKYLDKHFTFPETAAAKGIEGKLLITFVVDTDSSVSEVEIMGMRLGGGLDEEALRVIKSTSGMWIPGKENGKPARVRYIQPFKFSILGKLSSASDYNYEYVADFNIAQWSLEKAKYDDAIESYRKCIDNKFYVNTSKFNIGVCYFRKKDYKSALKVWHDLEAAGYKRKFDDIGLAYFAWGNEKLEQEQYPFAISFFTKALEYLPNDANVLYNRGIAYLKLGQKEMACQDWKTARKKGSKEAKNLIKEICQE